MATDYFTTDHFKLLNKWKGQKRDDSNPEQNQAYEELKRAYVITESWAKLVQERLYPNGYVEVRKRPTNQANVFASYNWAKIYPKTTSPVMLAYTVGIDADQQFVVKIDTVQADGTPERKKFEVIRGPYSNESPITTILTTAKGLELSMAELVDWTVDTIKKFKLSYDEVVKELGLKAEEERTRPTATEEVPEIEHTPINKIYYGPPGTGKTHAILGELAKHYTSQAASLTADEWRKGQIADQIAHLTWWETMAAALYDLGKPVDVGSLAEHPFIYAKASGVTVRRSTLWGILQAHAVLSSKTVNVSSRQSPGVFDKTADSKWQLAGDWKNECDDIIAWVDRFKNGPEKTGEAVKRYEFVTFHQSYGYEEFIEGLRPVLGRESEQVSYEIRSGAFRRLCERARLDPQHAYAMVIDEVNRGNISKIFGELITLIEPDKRAGGDHAIEVTLPYSGDKFSVPRNVDVLGSMNTADRSLALVDTALRRRFEFVSVMPDPALLAGLVVSKDGIDIDLQRVLTVINQRIEAIFDRDHTIGHAYLLGIKEVPDEKRFDALKSVFEKRIIPLLEEYFFDDWKKIRLVLGDNQKVDPALHFIQESESAVDLESLFGQDHELDGMRPRCTLNMKALELPKAYVAIYDAKLMKTKPA